MKREEIFNKIINGLYSCKDEYGEGLDVHFNSNQLRDFANTLTSFFPDNLEYKLTLLEIELFDNIPDKEEMLLQLFKFHLLSVYTYLFNNSIYKEKGYNYKLNINLLTPLEDEIQVNDKLNILYFKTTNPSMEQLKLILKNNGNYIVSSKEEVKEELAKLLNGEIKMLKERIATDKKVLATLNKDYKNLFL